MQNKKIVSFGFLLIVLLGGLQPALADDVYVESADVFVEDSDGDFVEENLMDEVAMDAIENYSPDGSLFQQITDLEQEKILMQLEKERAQLDLELDRLAAEKIKLHMEIDTLSGRAEQQQQEIETQKAKLEAEAARIEREKESWLAEAEKSAARPVAVVADTETPSVNIDQKYRLVNVVGAGGQLQATVEDLTSGQTKRITVGKTLDGLTVKSISVYDGVVFSDDNGTTQTLNVSNGN
ncbi:MAG: type IV pilus biogenesis protein PilP [Alphaproteobacteria bacterium]